MITFFTPKADAIVGVNCNSLVASLKNPNPKDIPEKILSITHKKHIFQFQYNTTSKQVTPDFIFNGLLDQPDTQKQIDGQSSASQITQEEKNTSDIEIPQSHQLALPIQSAPVLTPSPNEILPQISLTGEQSTEVMIPTESIPSVAPPPSEIPTQISLTGEHPAEESIPPVAPLPDEISDQANPTQKEPAKGMQTRSRTDAVQVSNIPPSNTAKQTDIEKPDDANITNQNDPVNTPVQPQEYSTDAISKSSASTTSKSLSSKRALFQDKTTDAKKNKKE
ncbi:hypothetical protein CTI12_AA220630 [Artemisia annua]|uniref:Uncharacterized protein n=1 Tax=Artemisia annua TaxID=35608 RepID=A0A2U1NWT3_ARTAN|nr:hypothetical protein CTI12_AA220630 [Artemisia annua]